MPLSVFADMNIRFKHIGLEDGLSQEAVTSIFQDHDGFLWFGTQEGLNRYDGFNFEVFQHDKTDPQSIGNDLIYDIAQKDDHHLWIATNGGVSILNLENETFETISLFRPDGNGNDIRVLTQDQQGTMWLGSDAGLLVETKGKIVTANADLINIRDLLVDDRGGLWVAMEEGGLCHIETAQEPQPRCTNIPLLSKRISSLWLDSEGLWVGSYDHGVALVDPLSHQIIRHHSAADADAFLPSDQVTQIHGDDEGRLWFLTYQGLAIKQGDQAHLVESLAHDPFSLSTNRLRTLFFDQGGILWVGSYKGIDKWNTDTSTFEHFMGGPDATAQLADPYVSAIFQSNNQDLWIGSIGGLDRLNRTTGARTRYRSEADNPQSIASNTVMSLGARHDGELWVGTRRSGLDHIDLATGRITHYRHRADDPNSLPNDAITSIITEPSGKLWLGTFGGGISLFDPTTEDFTHFQHNAGDTNSLSSNRVLSLTRDSGGLIWVATYGGGVSLLNPTTGTIKKFRHNKRDPHSLGSDEVFSILEDSQGNIWLGTLGDGVNLLTFANRVKEQYRFDAINRQDGLPSNTAYGVLEDNEGQIWISTNKGLSKLDPNNHALTHYNESHGLQGNEFNSGAFFKAPDGQLLFGGTNGLTAFDPRDLTTDSTPPPVVLTRFLKKNQPVPLTSEVFSDDGIVVNYEDYLVAFEFVALDYTNPRNNQYRYKLEGFDDDWIDAGDVRRATYTNLPTGRYTFRVQAANNDGVWNRVGLSVPFRVTPAPWATNWAYLAYGALVALLIALLYSRYYQKQLLRAQRARAHLETQVAQRTSALQDANQQLLDASITDQLTGLYNRRYLHTLVEQQAPPLLKRIQTLANGHVLTECGSPRLLVLMFDLDGFKYTNDTYGHGAGDEIMTQLGSLLRKTCRTSDTLIRWGGDEFMLVSELNNLDEAPVIAERLRQSVMGHRFTIGDNQALQLSCSIGYSVYPLSLDHPDLLDMEQIQQLADLALYQSKHGGRNQWHGLLATEGQAAGALLTMLNHDLDALLSTGSVRLVRSDVAKATPEQPKPNGRAKILLCSQRPKQNQAILSALPNFDCLLARDEEQAGRLIHGEQPDLLLVEDGFGYEGGTAFCRRLTQLGTAAQLPMVLLTEGNASAILAQDADHGICDFITPPYDLQSLSERLNFIIHRAQRVAQQTAPSMIELDPLTGLYNRHSFTHHLRSLVNPRDAAATGSLLFIDVNNFKRINAGYGYHGGDRVLAVLAKRLSSSINHHRLTAAGQRPPGSIHLGRIGGDEFALYLEDLDDRELLSQLAQELDNTIHAPVVIDGQTVSLQCSIGICRLADGQADAGKLLKSAERAMDHAKAKGKNFGFYQQEMEQGDGLVRLEHDLATAIEEDGLSLHYQPQMDAKTGDLFGVEALCRWQHPTEGRIGPDIFIPLAESAGLILPLGDWVLDQACRQARQWLDQGLALPSIAVNVSSVQFYQDDFVSKVLAVLAKYQLPGKLLELELTESVIMNDVDANVGKFHQLRQHGVQVAIDDFGTGYSSLSYLTRLPIDTLKIDRSFVGQLGEHAGSEAIVAAIQALASSLDLRVVAEGVEVQEQIHFLQGIGCHTLQGYYFSPPLVPDAIPPLLANQPVPA